MDKKKKSLLILGVFIMVVALTGVSLAFFNYTRTGTANTISVGRIAFTTRQTKTINLTNVFPIATSDVSTDTDNVGIFELEIEGDTDYVDGVEYLVSSENTHITTSTGKSVPISLDIDVTNLGTASPNYFTARESKDTTMYKKIVGDTLVGDQMLLVGYIKRNTELGTKEGVNGKITIKAYLDKDKIAITDTLENGDIQVDGYTNGTTDAWVAGRTVLTTTEWNSLQSSGISFQVKVEANEGIWVKGSLEEIMRQENFDATKNRGILDNEQSEFVSASTGIDFGAISSDTNGKGVYMRAGTQNDDYPIVYYRGAVDNNNVVFNNKCWKSVRTTDTGGVKLIYNGELSREYVPRDILSKDNYTNVSTPVNAFTFDTTDNSWNITITDGSNPSISFNVPAGDNYSLVMTGTSGSTTGGTYNFYKNGTIVYSNGGGGGTPYAYTYSYGSLTASDVIKFSFFGSGTDTSPITFKLIMQQNSSAIAQSNYIVGESFTYDEATQKWSSTVEPNKQATIEFNVSAAGDYFVNFTNPNGGPFYIYKNGTVVSTPSGTQKVKLLNLQTTDKIVVDYSQYNTSSSGEVEFYITKAEIGVRCVNTGTDTQITINDTNIFQFSGNDLCKSPAYNGYMYGTVYEWTDAPTVIEAYFGNDFEYNNGVYGLTNAKVGYDGTHHYSCNLTSSDGTCSSIRYYFYAGYYITLTNGESVEDALKKMQANITSSNAKIQIDTWYAGNMNTVTNKLEDTIWCNNRSIVYKAGWDPNGNVKSGNLSYLRTIPSLSCTNPNDAFTVNNGAGNQKLQYPVALLTKDEIALAGGSSTSYLDNGEKYWSLSPALFHRDPSFGPRATNSYDLNSSGSVDYSYGLRPSVSLKPGMPVIEGDGTVNNPFVIK